MGDILYVYGLRQRQAMVTRNIISPLALVVKDRFVSICRPMSMIVCLTGRSLRAGVAHVCSSRWRIFCVYESLIPSPSLLSNNNDPNISTSHPTPFTLHIAHHLEKPRKTFRDSLIHCVQSPRSLSASPIPLTESIVPVFLATVLSNL